MELNPQNNELNLQQEAFCRFYTQNRELFGNATLAYAEAYNYRLDELSREDEIDEKGNKKPNTSEYDRAYNTCSVNGSRLLRISKIDERIRDLLNEMLLDKVIDAELVSIILKGEKDSDRVAAIREYNKLKQRIIEKTDLTSRGEKITGISYVLPEETNGNNGQTN